MLYVAVYSDLFLKFSLIHKKRCKVSNNFQYNNDKFQKILIFRDYDIEKSSN